MAPTAGTTIYAVAEQAGVSIATVSRVLQNRGRTSPESRHRVVEAARRLNYVPARAARSLAVGRAEAQGLVLPALTGPYFAELVLGVEAAAARLGQSVLVRVAESTTDPIDLNAWTGRVDGLIVAAPSLDANRLRTLAAALPVVLIGHDEIPGCDTVRTENRHSAEVLTDHLAQHGRLRPWFLGDPHASPDQAERWAGMSAALARRGETPLPPLRVAQTEEAADAALPFVLARLRADHPPDALFCSNDELALAFSHGLRRHGMVAPRDLAVTGWDDVPAARYVQPGLTTVRQPIRRLGESAARRLHARITGAPESAHPSRTLLPTTPIFRSSCGCPEPAE